MKKKMLLGKGEEYKGNEGGEVERKCGWWEEE